MSLVKMIGILRIIRMVYDQFLRPALIQYVQSTENDLDDQIVEYIDLIIYFEPKKKGK